jgi:molybdopterin converting factor subunit 1
MIITVLFFGITTDLVGDSKMQIEVAQNCSIVSFKAVLKNQFPQLDKINSYAIAINEEYAADQSILNEGDVVAVIPPVSGG